MSEEFRKEPVPNLHGETDIFVQFATVESHDWRLLPDSAQIMVSITDCNGKYGKTIPFNKKDFEAKFFEASENIYCCKVRAVIHRKSNLAELFILSQQDKETGTIIKISPRRLHETFQPVYN